MPFAYFKNILKDELNEILSTQTNLYSMQETAKPINTAWGEIAINRYMLYRPAYVIYLLNKTLYAHIAEMMLINWYKAVRQYVHLNDN